MTKIKDIVVNVVIVFFWFVSTILIVTITDYKFLVFLPAILFLSLKIYLKRRKRIFEFVKADFEKIGYELMEERPLKFIEFFFFDEIELKPTLYINNVPVSRLKYIATFVRIFKAKNKDGKLYELKVFIGKKWSAEIEIAILSTKKVY